MFDDETITPLRVQAFLNTAKPHERLVYHVGNLAEQRTKDRDLAAVAHEAYKAAERKECVLLQQRYGRPDEGNMIYLIEKRGF